MRVRDEGADRGHVDDAPGALREHLPAESLAGEVGALEVERDDPVELLFGELLGGRAVGHPRAVDEDVGAAEFVDDAIGERVDLLLDGHVARE